jgi:hypothetical protein
MLQVLVTSSTQDAGVYICTHESISRLQRLQHLVLEGVRPPSARYDTDAFYAVAEADAIFR